MRANALVLCVALLSTGCASVSLAPSRSGSLCYNMPRGASGLALTQPAHEEHPHTWTVSPLSSAGDVLRGRKVRRIAPRDDTTGAASGGVAGGTAASAPQVRDAVLEAVDGVAGNAESAVELFALESATGAGESINGMLIV